MRIMFVYDNMYGWGGIQTLLVRTIPKLAAMGHDVTLLTRPRGEAHDATSEPVGRLARDAAVVMADDNWLRGPRRPHELELPPADVVVPCDVRALFFTSMLERCLPPSAAVVIAVFAPREYCWKFSVLGRPWHGHLSARIVRELPLENMMFATDGMVRQTGACAGRDLTGAPVLPLAIDAVGLRQPPGRSVDRHKIVSVARLVSYYTHHRQMLHVIRELRDAGSRFEYHVYGEGEERAALESEARQLGVEDAVFLHGTVPYERFPEVVGDAFAYIGLGTALIEAAACGVPALVGIDSVPRPVCYGFVQDTTGNDIGGYVPGHREYRIAERIQWLAGLSDPDYREVGAASRRRAEQFDTSALLPRLVEILSNARPARPGISWGERQVARIDEFAAAALWKLGLNTSTTARHLVTHEC